MQINNSNTISKLEGKLKASRLKTLFFMLGLFSFCMALVCLPLYGKPVSFQSLFNLILLMPVFRYVFLGFLLAGMVFVIIGILITSYYDAKDFGNNGIPPEERVRMAHEKDK